MKNENFIRCAYPNEDGNVVLENDLDFTLFQNLKNGGIVPEPRKMGYPKDSNDPRTLAVYSNHEIAINVSILVNIEATR
jgi:hypothetical protein